MLDRSQSYIDQHAHNRYFPKCPACAWVQNQVRHTDLNRIKPYPHLRMRWATGTSPLAAATKNSLKTARQHPKLRSLVLGMVFYIPIYLPQKRTTLFTIDFTSNLPLLACCIQLALLPSTCKPAVSPSMEWTYYGPAMSCYYSVANAAAPHSGNSTLGFFFAPLRRGKTADALLGPNLLRTYETFTFDTSRFIHDVGSSQLDNFQVRHMPRPKKQRPKLGWRSHADARASSPLTKISLTMRSDFKAHTGSKWQHRAY